MPHAIHVIATSDEDTRAAIEDAVLRARVQETSIVVWIPRTITPPMHADARLPFLVDEYTRLIKELGGTGRVRVCLSLKTSSSGNAPA